MKRIVLLLGMAFTFGVVTAQNTYIVKTRGAMKTLSATDGNGAQAESEEDSEPDFVRDNFKFYSLCDWQDGMKFMVMPERYGLGSKSVSDATTNEEVRRGCLRYKMMIYKGRTVGADGR